MSTLFRFSPAYLKLTAERKNLSVYRLARLTKEIDPESKGVCQTAITNIFTGKSEPSTKTLSFICAALGISPKSRNLWLDEAGE